MRKVVSREYKVMLEHRWLEKRKKDVELFWQEATDAAKMCGLEVDGTLESPEKREIIFFDTADHLFYRNGLIFRRRVEANGEFQFTLKARNEDRYIADGFNLDAADGLKNDAKFEEDIAAPFRSRFSHSNTLAFEDANDSPFGRRPESVEDAKSLFPVLGELSHGDGLVSPKTKLFAVNEITANERVYRGPVLTLAGSESASIAVILWSKGWDGRPLVAEFSFRYKNKDEGYPATVAWSARRFFEALQQLDWCRATSMTKTQYIYRKFGS